MKPPGDALRRADWLVDSIPLGMAAELITAHHYARGAANTAVFRHGLFPVDAPLDCRGAALWMPPTRAAAESVARTVPGTDWREVLTLSRLVIEPGMPTNAASYLLGRSIRLIRADGRYRVLVTYADQGQGHTGGIYRATNWRYDGLRGGDPVYADTEGRHVSRKAGPLSRTDAEMRALGYRNLGRSMKHRFVLEVTP